ncbi:MAG: MucBP domain-containing protein [Lacrimispora sp.]
MKIKATKFLSLLLTVLLLVSAFPVSAHSEDIVPEIVETEINGPADQQQEGHGTTDFTNEETTEPEETSASESTAEPEETSASESTAESEETSGFEETSGTEETNIPKESGLGEINEPAEAAGPADGFSPPQSELFVENEVADFQELKEAVQNAQEGDIIFIADDIDFTETLNIQKNLIFKAADESGVSVLTSAAQRHIAIPVNCDVTLTFDRIELNGAGTGGGITVSGNAALTLEDASIYNCVFSGSGGGISVHPDAGLIMIGSQVFDNTASSNGGGVFGASSSQIIIRDSQISGNKAMGEGGGGIAGSYTTIQVSGSTIYNNRAKDGGGIYGYSTPISITDTEISGNEANHNGGGIWVKNLEELAAGEDVIFANNMASQAYLMINEDDIALHEEKIKTTYFTSPFEYAYNNFDVVYMEGTPLTESTVIVRYVDADGKTIAPSETYSGVIGEPYTITSPAVPGYYQAKETSTGQPTFTGTYTLEPQTIVFRYIVKSGGAARWFYSFGFQTDRTVTPLVNDDYKGNVVYYPDAGDTLTAYYDMYVYAAASGQSTDVVYFPVDGKQILDGIPELAFGMESQPAPMSAEEAAEYGYWITVVYSADHGVTFTAAPPDNLSDTNAMGIRIIKADDATALESNAEPLVIMVEFPVKIVEESLAAEEADGSVPLGGWQYKTPSGKRNSPVGVFLSSPQVKGTVGRQELSEGGNIDWSSTVGLRGRTVELLDEYGNVLGTTVTGEDGKFSFSHITTLDKLQVRVTGDARTVYFMDPDTGTYLQTGVIPVGGIIDMDRISGRFSDVTWKNSAGEVDINAANSQDKRFIVVTAANNENAGGNESNNGGSNGSENTGGNSSESTGGNGGDSGSGTGNSNTGGNSGNSNTGGNSGDSGTGNSNTGGNSGNNSVGNAKSNGNNSSDTHAQYNSPGVSSDSSKPDVNIGESKITESGELSDMPKTGDTGFTWIFYGVLMLITLIGAGVLTYCKEEEQYQ